MRRRAQGSDRGHARRPHRPGKRRLYGGAERATDYMLSRGLTGMDNHVPSTLNDVCIVWCELLGANPYVKEAEK